MASGTRANGVDVSRWQGSIDWKKVRAAGAEFAIVKATEGLDFVDPSFTPARVNEIHGADLMVSAYHFARPQPGRTGGAEARHFLQTARKAGYGERGDLPLVLDLESTKLPARETLNFARQFVHVIREETGRSPFLYTFPSFWQHTMGDPDEDLNCPLWIAHYGPSKPIVPRGWKTWDLWQHTDKGRCPGITGAVDLNWYNGSPAELRAEFMRKSNAHPGFEPKPKPKPKPKPRKPPASNHYPAGLPERYRWHWDHPWTVRAARHTGFRKWLDDHGYLSPNFKIAEARCKDGTPVPKSLNKRCRDHAFNLEKLRHALGGKPLPIISWYRHRAYNTRIGGATNSKHIEAIATDHSREWVERVGRAKVLAAGNRIFANGGMGTYPAGSMHFDTRGVRARWSSF